MCSILWRGSTRILEEAVNLPSAPILQSASKAPTVCTSAQTHAKNWAKALRLWKDLCIALMAASSCFPDIFLSTNCDGSFEVSETTALRYILCSKGGVCMTEWVLRWLQAFQSVSHEHLQSTSPPNFGFMRVEGDAFSDLSYCSTLAALRSLLSSWGGISKEQVLLYTLHSMKATFLSFHRVWLLVDKVRSGWRPCTPLRGVHFLMNEPCVAFADASNF